MQRLLAACLVSCALPAAGVQAQVLQCVDSQGRKEYAAVCPPGTVPRKEIRPQGTSRPDAGNETAPSTYQERELAFQQRRIERESAEAAAAQKQKRQQVAERYCADIRRRMAVLQSGRPLRWADAATGERPVMTEDEHAAEMRQVEAELRRCGA